MSLTGQGKSYATEFIKKYKSLDNAINNYFDHGIPQDIENKCKVSVKAKDPVGGLFDNYKSDNDANKMEAKNVMKFLEDWGLKQDDPMCVVFNYQAGAKTSGMFTREEFNGALRTLDAFDIKSLKGRENKFRKLYLDDKTKFKAIWKYTFDLLSQGKKVIPNKYGFFQTQVMFKNKYTLCNDWIRFIQLAEKENSGFSWTKDLWLMSCTFLQDTKSDFSNYSEDDAWPLLIQDYVYWKQNNETFPEDE